MYIAIPFLLNLEALCIWLYVGYDGHEIYSDYKINYRKCNYSSQLTRIIYQ